MGLNATRYRLVINGTDKTDVFAPLFKSLTITDDVGIGDDSLTLVLFDDGETQIPEAKALIVASLAYNGGFVEMGSYTVNDVDIDLLGNSITISAGAADMSSAIKAPLTKTWREDGSEITLRTIGATIAAKYGLDLIIDPILGSIGYPVVNQTAESDLNLLKRLAKAIGAAFKLASGRLIIASKGSAKTIGDKPMARREFKPNEKLSDLSVSIIDRNFYASATAKYIVEGNPEPVSVTIGEGEPVLEIRAKHQTEVLAIEAGRKAIKEAAQGKRTLSLTTEGDPTIRAESVAVLTGWREGVNGDYVVSAARHQLTPNGYTVSIESKELK